MNSPHANRRLQVATRIHYALMRELGHGIDVGRLLKYPLYARDVLLVCEACTGNDLQRLAKAFIGLSQPGEGPDSQSGMSGFGSSVSWPASQASVAPEGWAESLPVA